jgi:subtilase family serine protease
MTFKKMLFFALPCMFAGSLCTGQTAVRSAIQTVSREPALVQLTGQVAPIVSRSQDLGRVSPNLPFEHVFLQLKRTPAQEAALDQAIADLHNPKSPSFHKWMTAAQFGAQFGATDAQIQQVTDYLAANGLQVEGTNEGRTILSFSGVAGTLEQAFHTEIHTLNVHGVAHVSNISELSIPASLSGLISGVSMSDFKPHPLVSGARSVKRNVAEKKLVQVGTASPDFTTPYEGGFLELVAPGDFATIYNLTPLWNQGYRGAGQMVAVVEDSLIKAADVTTYRNAFGLSQYKGTFTQEMPAGALPCGNPGANGAELEAALDAQWAGSTAPDAAIVLAACADTRTEFGGLIATVNLLSQKTLPNTISMSYGECEVEMGQSQINQFGAVFQQAVAEGVTVFVSSGDEGAASCDADQHYAENGIQVSGFGSTPYNVSVGGTDFYDTALNTNSQYWSNTNSVTFTSALSYVPEKTWNDSCADSTIIGLEGYTVGYGASGFCNSYQPTADVTTASGSGGASSVWLKPSWQNVAGIPADNVRDMPDVSLFSANGFYGHALVFCDSDPKSYGVPCDFSNPTDAALDIAGGTSFASPAMAGIFALITQKYGSQGNADIGLYTLAASEYGTQTAPISAAPCNSTLGTGIGSTCTFNDVTEGNIAVPCFEANCYGSNYNYGLYGVLSVDTSQFTPAYPTTPAWDFATGLGSVNVANLFNNWAQVMPPSANGNPGEAPVGTSPAPPSAPVAPKQPISPVQPIAPILPIRPIAPVLGPVSPVAPVLAPVLPIERVDLVR